jgi:hypothetical protein
MKTIPKPIKERVSNALYFLRCADKLSASTDKAAHILMLLIGWENVVIADEELSAWIDKKKVDPKVYRDHAYKFKKASGVLHVILGARGAKAKTIEYSSPALLKKLREYCQYGIASESKDVSKSFSRMWYADEFRNKLINKINWTSALISAIEHLPDEGRAAKRRG